MCGIDSINSNQRRLYGTSITIVILVTSGHHSPILKHCSKKRLRFRYKLLYSIFSSSKVLHNTHWEQLVFCIQCCKICSITFNSHMVKIRVHINYISIFLAQGYTVYHLIIMFDMIKLAQAFQYRFLI